jgi:hypothetical protein
MIAIALVFGIPAGVVKITLDEMRSGKSSIPSIGVGIFLFGIYLLITRLMSGTETPTGFLLFLSIVIFGFSLACYGISKNIRVQTEKS